MSTALFFNALGDTRAVITNAAGQRWRDTTSALETHTDGNWANYLLTPARLGTSQTVVFTVPSGLPAGIYTVAVYEGTSPPVTSPVVGSVTFAWDGAAIVVDGGPRADLTATPAATANTQTKVDYLFNALRFEARTTDTLLTVRNAAGVVISEATLADDGTTSTKGAMSDPA